VKQLNTIKEIHYNKCPAVAPLGVLNESAQQRLGINLKACLEKADKLIKILPHFKTKLLQVYQNNSFEPIGNPDHALYSGGFFSNSDKDKMEQIRVSNWQNLSQSSFNFDDSRLDTLLFRYRARNAPESLNSKEKQQWQAFKQDNFYNAENSSSLSHQAFAEKIKQLSQDDNNDKTILNQVDNYVQELVKTL